MRHPADVFPFFGWAREVSSWLDTFKISELILPPSAQFEHHHEMANMAHQYFGGTTVSVFRIHGVEHKPIACMAPFDAMLMRYLPQDYVIKFCSVKEVDYLDVLDRVDFQGRGADGSPTVTLMFQATCKSDSEDVSSEMALLLDKFATQKSEELLTRIVMSSRSVGKPYTAAQIDQSLGRDTDRPVATDQPMRKESAPLQEADVDIDLSSLAGIDIEASVALDNQRVIIKDYIEKREMTQRVLLLLGHTAVAKSAVVREVTAACTNPPRRLVDFRCAFLAKYDIEGLRHFAVDPETGKYVSDSSPMDKLFICTDEYIDYCEKMEPKIEALLQDKTLSPDEIAAIEETLSNIRHNMKWPVLFLDEMTRAERTIQGAFVLILNQKEFQGFKFKKARLIAASNHPGELSPQYSRFRDMYQTVDLEDVGVFDRNESLEIKGSDVSPRWVRWISEEGRLCPQCHFFVGEAQSNSETKCPQCKNVMHPDDLEVTTRLDPMVVDFIKELKTDGSFPRAYDITTAFDELNKDKSAGKRVSPEHIGSYPFPNFRTWEFISQYLRRIRPQFQLDPSGRVKRDNQGGLMCKEHNKKSTRWDKRVILSLIGNNTISDDFIETCDTTLTTSSTVERTEEDALTSGVRISIETGVPLMMIGMSSIGKTSRVKALAREYQAHVIQLNLGQKARIDIMGAPTDVDVHHSFLSSSSKGDRGRGGALSRLRKAKSSKLTEMESIFKESRPSTFPAKLTTMAPDRRLADEINWALNIKGFKKVILFFDELNRADKLTMSAVFEAVSDHRFGGVTFDPHRVVIMAACNMGSNYNAANPLDPATAGRFIVIKKYEMDGSDIDATIKYMKERVTKDGVHDPYHPSVIKYLRNKIKITPDGTKDYSDLKSIYEAIESRTVNKSAPSLRAWDDVDRLLKQLKGSSLLSGKLLETTAAFSTVNKIRNLDEAIEKLSALPENWAGYGTGDVGKAPHASSVKTYLNKVLKAVEAARDGLQRGDVVKNITEVQDLCGSAFRIVAQRNTEVESYRQDQFKIILGHRYAEDFLTYYNKVAGDVVLDIPDLVSKKLMLQYVKQMWVVDTNVSARAETALEAVKAFWSFWNTKTSSATKYQSFLLAIGSRAGSESTEVFGTLLGAYNSYPEIKSFIDLACTRDFSQDELLGKHIKLQASKQMFKDEADEYWGA